MVCKSAQAMAYLIALTTEVLVENVERAHTQTAIWKSAANGEPLDLHPTKYE